MCVGEKAKEEDGPATVGAARVQRWLLIRANRKNQRTHLRAPGTDKLLRAHRHNWLATRRTNDISHETAE